MSGVQAEKLDRIFRALADATRREMLVRLSGQPMTVTELAEPYDMSLAGASKHIKVLEGAGLIQRSVQGRRHLCCLDAEALASAHEWIRFYEYFWNEQLDALDKELMKDG